MSGVILVLKEILKYLKIGRQFVFCADCQCCAGMERRGGKNIFVLCCRTSKGPSGVFFSENNKMEPGCGQGIPKTPFKAGKSNEED